MVRENEDKTSVADNMNQPTAKTSCDSDDMPDVGVGVFLHICLHNAILMDILLLHQIFIFSIKVKQAAVFNNDFPLPPYLTHSLPTYLMNELTNKCDPC